jgi:hypothetical protein
MYFDRKPHRRSCAWRLPQPHFVASGYNYHLSWFVGGSRAPYYQGASVASESQLHAWDTNCDRQLIFIKHGRQMTSQSQSSHSQLAQLPTKFLAKTSAFITPPHASDHLRRPASSKTKHPKS